MAFLDRCWIFCGRAACRQSADRFGCVLRIRGEGSKQNKNGEAPDERLGQSDGHVAFATLKTDRWDRSAVPSVSECASPATRRRKGLRLPWWRKRASCPSRP